MGSTQHVKMIYTNYYLNFRQILRFSFKIEKQCRTKSTFVINDEMFGLDFEQRQVIIYSFISAFFSLIL